MAELALHEVSDKTIDYDLPLGAHSSGSWFERREVDELGKLNLIANWGVDTTPTAHRQEAETFSASDLGKAESSTQADILNNIEGQIQDLIFRIRKSKHERLAKRLFSLYNDAKEEDPTSVGISLGSLGNLLNFLQTHGNLKKPSITLTDDNNIYASWRTDGRLFSMHFLPDGVINFVVFSPNRRHPGKKIDFPEALRVTLWRKL